MIGRDGIFREYTLHDFNHIHSMLLMVDKIIPAETAQKMKIADWLLIVLSCYFHDLGMVVTRKEFENRYNGTDFQIFKACQLEGDKGKDYEDALVNLLDDEREEFLYQEFVRSNHAKRIFHWIQGQDAVQYGDAKEAVEAVNDLLAGVELVVRDDLAKICLSHHEDDLFDFDKYQVNRVYGDTPEGEANLHYAAIILRSVDVLQIQKKRVPPVLYKLIDPSNPKSQEEWAKQAGVRAIKPQTIEESDIIEVHASFQKESAYFGLLAYLQQFATKELERCYDWAQQAQKKGSKFKFPWRRIDTSQVEPRGFEGRNYSFQLDQEKILKLLTGHTLYNDSMVAIREVLQNALDAVRFRKHLFPDEAIGKIEIIWNSKARKLIIRDTGTGMTQEIIEKFLLNVGSSYYQSETVLQKHAEFSPISRFGIGILSTFMIADEVQILTVHPDDEFARRLTLPSVVKSYLIKKIPKGNSDVRLIGQHGTEVTLQIRRSAALSNVENLIRYWVVIPGCDITLTIDDSPPSTIGFLNVQEVLKYYYKAEIQTERIKREYKVKTESIPGIDIAYVLTKYSLTNVWDFAATSYVDDEIEGLDNFSVPPGICVEGIRIRSAPAGYKNRYHVPWVFANLTGGDSPKTNVARSDIEQNATFEHTLFKIYSLLGDHIQNEFNSLLKKKHGIVEAAWEADFLRNYGLESQSISDQVQFEKAMSHMKVIALEDTDTCRALSQQELDSMSEIWTVDSRLFRNIEDISGTLGIDLPTEKILKSLGKAIAPKIPLPRILGNSVDPFTKKDISKIRIYPEERTYRIDICWENQKPGRWNKLSNEFVNELRGRYGHHHRTSYDAIWCTDDKSILSECPSYQLVVWRRILLFLPNSVVPELVKSLGEENSAQWISDLIEYGKISTQILPLLKDQLTEAIGKPAEDLITRMVLPFEMRFGDRHGSLRDHHFF